MMEASAHLDNAYIEKKGLQLLAKHVGLIVVETKTKRKKKNIYIIIYI